MPPQRKKGAKVQAKNQQKISKVQDQIQAATKRTQQDDIESLPQDQIKYDTPIEDDIQNNNVPLFSPLKAPTSYEINNAKGKKKPAQKVQSKEALTIDTPSKQKPARTRHQLANKNTESLPNKSVDNKKAEAARVTETSKAQAKGQKKKDTSDTKSKKKNQRTVNDSSQRESDIENCSEENMVNLDEIPLRQPKSFQQQQSVCQKQNKEITNQQFMLHQSKLTIQQQQLTIQQQQQSLNSKIADQKAAHPKNPVVPKIETPQENSGDKKKLTIREMEGLSKLLSIQVDGLKMKELQMYNMLSSNQNNNSNNKNNMNNSNNKNNNNNHNHNHNHIHNNNNNNNNINNKNNNNNNNYRMNSNLPPKAGAIQNQNQQMSGPNPNYSIKNLLNGIHARKIQKPNPEVVIAPTNRKAIVQNNLTNLRQQLNELGHIVIDDEEMEDHIYNSQYGHEGNGQVFDDLENIYEVQLSYPQVNHINNRQQIGQRVPLKSITPQNKILSTSPINQQQQQHFPSNKYGQYSLSNGYQQQNQNPYQRKSVTPTGKIGGNNMGRVTPVISHNSIAGKITPINSKLGNQVINGYVAPHMNGKITPMNNGKITPMNNGKITPMNMNGNDLGNGKVTPLNGGMAGKRTPIIYGNQQHPQINRMNIENEIQSRIETIKNNIGPLLACLNSDFMGSNMSNQQIPQQQQQQQPKGIQQESIQENNFLNRRIYQDMRERRMNDCELVSTTPHAQLQQQVARGRSLTPTITGNRRHFDSDMSLSNPNLIQNNNNMQRATTPIRGLKQQPQPIIKKTEINSHQQPQQLTGRNYDARAGDWLCGNCKNFNFAYRNICNRCGQLQDENIHMVHPEITTEALDLIHELNHKGFKKTPIRTLNDVKRTFQNVLSDKENQKNISNVNNQNTIINPQNVQPRFNNNQKPYQRGQYYDGEVENKTPQQETSGYNSNSRRPRLTYKQLEEYENNLANTKINKDIQSTNNDQALNKNKDALSSNEIVGHKIVFIDNSSAQPSFDVESDKAEQNNNVILKEQADKSNVNNKQTKETINYQNNTNNLRKRVVDPRVQIR